MFKQEWFESDEEGAAGGVFKVLGGARTTVDGDSFDATHITKYRCVAPRHMTRRQITRAIYNATGSDPCGHSYDCCGCWHRYACDVKPAGKRNEYLFTVRSARNY